MTKKAETTKAPETLSEAEAKTAAQTKQAQNAQINGAAEPDPELAAKQAEEKARLDAIAEAAKDLNPNATLDEAIEEGNPKSLYMAMIRKSEVSTIPKRIYLHEGAILEALFGIGTVTVDLTSELPGYIEDAQEEFDRLLRVYGRKGEEAVRTIYSNAADLAGELGLKAPVRRRGLAGAQQGQFSAQR